MDSCIFRLCKTTVSSKKILVAGAIFLSVALISLIAVAIIKTTAGTYSPTASAPIGAIAILLIIDLYLLVQRTKNPPISPSVSLNKNSLNPNKRTSSPSIQKEKSFFEYETKDTLIITKWNRIKNNYPSWDKNELIIQLGITETFLNSLLIRTKMESFSTYKTIDIDLILRAFERLRIIKEAHWESVESFWNLAKGLIETISLHDLAFYLNMKYSILIKIIPFSTSTTSYSRETIDYYLKAYIANCKRQYSLPSPPLAKRIWNGDISSLLRIYGKGLDKKVWSLSCLSEFLAVDKTALQDFLHANKIQEIDEEDETEWQYSSTEIDSLIQRSNPSFENQRITPKSIHSVISAIFVDRNLENAFVH